MDATNKIVSPDKRIDKQGQYSRRNRALVYGLPENKTENTDDVVVSTISEKLKLESPRIS